MDVVRNFLARYEQTREEELSLEEYLDLCKRDKMAYATAAERMLARSQFGDHAGRGMPQAEPAGQGLIQPAAVAAEYRQRALDAAFELR